MEAIYSIPIFVSLTLIAIVTAVFVFASSFYKGSLELCAKEEEDALNRRKELINSKRKDVVAKIAHIDESAFTKELRAELDKIDAELTNIDQSIAKSRNKAKALTVVKIVVIPASFLTVSIITSGITIASSGTLPTTMFVISLILIAISSYFILKNLLMIESFSRTTDLGTLMEQALDRHVMKTKPIIDLVFVDYQLEINRGNTQIIELALFLKQGFTAKNVKIRFCGTEELDFPEESTKSLELLEYQGMRNPKEFYYDTGDLNYDVYQPVPFKVKVPDVVGKYVMTYWIQCDEFTSAEKCFTIKVI